jgi:hypothetical protein
MPTKRTRVARHIGPRITDAAVLAYSKGDYSALMFATNGRPWTVSPLDVDQDPPPTDAHPGPWLDSWPHAQEQQRALEAACKARGLSSPLDRDDDTD